MALETGSYISDLVAANPTATDPKSQGDDHLRLLKSTIKASFPNVSGAVSKTHTEINDLGYVYVAQNSKSEAYTLVLGDAGKHILHPSADTTARIWTIPANGSVAFPVGTAITFVNQVSGGVITIAITTDTMRLAGLGTTGSRTLAANGLATALKITTTEWIINGIGLT